MTLGASAAVRRAVAVVLLAAPLMLGGCTMTFDASNLGATTTLAERASEQPEGEAFRVSRKAVFGLWGIASISRPDLQRILAGQIRGEQSVSQLRITVKAGFVDVLASVLTAGLIIPRTVVYEGVIVGPESPE